jgi:hypothetical protein
MGVNLKPMVDDFYIKQEDFKPNSHDVEDGVITPGTHRVMRFDFYSHNAGNADLAVGAPEDNPNMFTWSSGHGHYHLKDFNRYTLYNAGGQEVGESYKQSFCLMDSVRINSWARSSAQFTDCNVDQGISAGWADKYRSTLPGQYVVIDGLPNGKYTLKVTTDYKNYFQEDYENDNTISVGLSINGNKVDVISPPYINDVVDAKNDQYKVDEGKKLYSNVLKNDTDTKGHDLDVSWYSQPKHGKLWLDKETGEFKYKPFNDKDKYNEKDSFQYKVTDDYGNTDTAMAYIKVIDDDKRDHYHGRWDLMA